MPASIVEDVLTVNENLITLRTLLKGITNRFLKCFSVYEMRIHLHLWELSNTAKQKIATAGI